MNNIKETLRNNRKYLFYEIIVLAIIVLFVFRDYLVVLPPINRDYPLAPSEIVLPRNTQLRNVQINVPDALRRLISVRLLRIYPQQK